MPRNEKLGVRERNEDGKFAQNCLAHLLNDDIKFVTAGLCHRSVGILLTGFRSTRLHVGLTPLEVLFIVHWALF